MMSSTDRNRVELAIVEILAARVADKLGDRNGDRHAPPWRPEHQVRIGALRPLFTDPAPDDGDVDAEEDTESDDDNSGEAPALESTGVIGLDAVVDMHGDALTVEVDAALSIYLPEFASYAEAQERQAAQVEEEEAAAHDPTPALDGEQPPGTGASSEPPAQPAAAPAPADDGAGDGPRRRAGIPVWDSWRRQRIEVHGMRVTLAADGAEHDVGEAIRKAIVDAITAHFRNPEASRPFTTATRTIPVAALASESDYWEALRERSNAAWTPSPIDTRVTVYAEPLGGTEVQLSVSITNETVVEVPPMPVQDLAIYDCELRVRLIDGADHVPQRFRLAPRDYRWRGADEVPGHGRGCAAVQDSDGTLRTETLPRFLQQRIEPRADHVPPPRFDDLATDPHSLLLRISEAMRTFENQWDQWLSTVTDPEIAAAARRDLDGFRDERRRFDAGRDTLNLDPRLEQSFRLTNTVFSRLSGGSYDTWRLFQLVYIVLHLPALAAREHRDRDELVNELGYVDVLWFPTGGGKTEAYLGLIVTALFYDRLRGKERGITAWMKFPLRMLSVQQLGRVLKALLVAEELRLSELAGRGRPFELGYLVGGTNTPNKLVPRTDSWWPGIDRAAAQLAEDPYAFDEHVIIGNCPYCGAAKRIGLELRVQQQRLVHICRSCERDLPVHMTDEEVYRYQPSVVVSTVDKITAFAWNAESTSLSRGPRFECPDHGWFSFGTCPGRDCPHTRRQWRRVTDWKDPVPALIVQDEMHLLREDLGTFSSHYEGLLHALQVDGPSELPSKIIAASATIEGFEAQLSQVYCRQPRRFPSPGWKLEQSFYVDTTPEARRMFMGVQPVGAAGRKVEVSGLIASELLTGATALADDLAGTAAAVAAATGIVVPEGDLARILFNYEVDLAFVNSKAHGAIIGDDFARLNDRLAEEGTDSLNFRTLTGEVTVPMLAEAIDLIEKADPTTPRKDRLRGLIGTSVVSHGVDLSRLNTMVMCGLPITTADYIQATARAGRTHVGLVVTVYDNWTAREVSSFTHFISTHRFLERLVEAVPVNRWAVNGVRRTLPGIAVAHIFDLARQNPWASDEDLKKVGNFQRWWNNNAATGAAEQLERRILVSYRSAEPSANPAGLEDELQDTAATRWRQERARMTRFDRDWIQELFREPAMTSLRDVDDPVSFGPMPHSARAYEALYGYIPQGDDE